jgi:hypothetical protein
MNDMLAERIAVAVEVIGQRLADPKQALATRVASLEEMLREFVSVMENPQSSDQEWADLLADVKAALEDSAPKCGPDHVMENPLTSSSYARAFISSAMSKKYALATNKSVT